MGIMGLVGESVLKCGLAVLLLFCSGGGSVPLTLTIENNCPFTVCPGLQPNEGHGVLQQGGFVLESLAQRSFDVPDRWNGRVWGRTGCVFHGGVGSCVTGDCDGRLQCGGRGAQNPVSLAQLSLHNDQDDVSSYTLSLVDGFNVPLTVAAHGGRGLCRAAECRANVLATCPRELQVRRNGGRREVVACKSACSAFRTDDFCCTNRYNTSATCRPSAYSLLFKRACPDAYSYAHDSVGVQHDCAGVRELKIIFCH